MESKFVTNAFGKTLFLESETDIGSVVLCDICNDDFTLSKEEGGFLFSGKGVCPHCAPRMLESIKGYNEEKYIKAYCPEGVSFRDWILQIRGGDNAIRIYTEK